MMVPVRLWMHMYVSVPECVCDTAGCVIVLGAEVLPVYPEAASFLPHIFQPRRYHSAVCPLLVSSSRLLSPP